MWVPDEGKLNTSKGGEGGVQAEAHVALPIFVPGPGWVYWVAGDLLGNTPERDAGGGFH